MELRHLRYLVAVVEERSFTRAAGRLHVAQPGISAQIKDLERELGQPLLDRTGRIIRPTVAGEAFLPYARAALEAAASGAANVAAMTGLVRGRLRVGTVTTISSSALDLAELLAGFHTQHPGIDIALQEASTADLLADIVQGRVDAAFVGLGPVAPPAEIETTQILRERLVAVMLPPPAGRPPRRVGIGDLADHTLIVPRSGTGLRDLLDAAFTRAGARPRIAFESGDPDLLVRLARAGLGTAVVPASAVAARSFPGLRSADLVPRIDGRISIARRRVAAANPAADAFVAHVRERVVRSS